ncbi:hypothetical protein N6H14_14155 [Paenibacillus sp. CC-CFT747]|nr:hypothetical protein N6H14_14155 [Paenibacillus sp. CC-CFT747]
MNQAMGKRYVAHSQILPLSKGHLYYGEDLSLQRDVILYASEYREGSASHDYMTRLGKASALTHESFQHILDTSLEGETLLVVLNRGNGSPLFEKVGETGWTFHKIITLVSELGKGMLDAMEAGLTGYSVACENLWLKDDGRAAVINYWETGVTETQGPPACVCFLDS